MRRLYLLRHAEAGHYGGVRGDHGRRLTDHGRDQARAAGATLADAGVELILASSASRALETAEGLGLGVPIKTSDELYNGDPQSMVEELAGLPDELEVVALVAHSPGVPALAHALATDDSDAEAFALIGHRFPPATLVGLEFEGTWASLRSARLFTSRLG